MNLHNNSEQFLTLVNFTAEHFHILPAFIEKDYWITRSLQRMAHNPNADKVVFKGGTALAKAFRLTNRFSEDIDIAIIDANSMTGNHLKMLIKRLAKDMTSGLEEKITKGITSKGSRFYRSIYHTELRPLAFIEIPDEKQIENTFLNLMERIKIGS